MSLAPITLFVYNRLDHTKKTIEALQKNELASDSDLIIFSDAAKNEADVDNVRILREYLKTVDGFKSVKIIERSKNFGLAESIINGVTEIVNQYGKIIVLEDDLVTSPYFLKYMNEALDMYENEDSVYSVHGYIYPMKGNLPETYFSKEINCWGWGTWQRAWDLLELNGARLLEEIRQKKLIKKFDLNYSYHYSLILKEQVYGINNSWAIRWYASAFLANKLGLHPGKSLIKNIGFDNSGTNTGKIKIFNSSITEKPINVSRIVIEDNYKAAVALEKYFKSPKNLIIFQLMRIKNELLFFYKASLRKIKN